MKLRLTKILFAILLFSGALAGCQKFDKCEGILCFTPPPGFYLEVVDKELEANLFSADNLQTADIELKNENDEAVEVTFISENEINLIDISAIGWVTGAHTYYLQLSDNLEIVIDIEMQEKYEDCCTFFEVVKFDIRDYDYEMSQYSEIIRVKI